MRLEVPEEAFVSELAQKIAVPGMRPENAITQILAHYMSVSAKSYLGFRLKKPPTIYLSDSYTQKSVLTLPELASNGYTIWYPEIRFSTKPSDKLDGITPELIGAISLGPLVPYYGNPNRYKLSLKPLKTQTNHVLNFQNFVINGELFARVKSYLENAAPLKNPYMANPFPKFGKEMLFHKVAVFDHVLDGNRVFCSCAKEAHQKMIADAKERQSHYVPGSSWPHQVIQVLSEAQYLDTICHMCIARNFGQDAVAERYGDSILDFVEAYTLQLMLVDGLDNRTARADVQARLGMSRWIREQEMYLLIKQIFPDDMVLREASPPWLGRQRLDVFLPDRRIALEYQGVQHYEPVEMFGGAEALQRTMERDALKKRLCEENQVELLYIKHSDPLTLASLRNRMHRFIDI